MKKIYLILALLLGSYAAQCQRLQSAEYFVGIDPGVGNATSLSITVGDTLNQVFGIPVTSLSQGFNNLSVRTKDSLGIWSITKSRIFYKMPIGVSTTSSPIIMRMEYFVDVDPGNGNATPINFTTVGDSTYQVFSVGVSSLSDGFHNLAVRVQDSLGFWSITENRIFYKMPISTSTTSSPIIMRMEYFVDIDPGNGNATPINFTAVGDSTYQVFSIGVSSLSDGFHNLAVRVQDSLGFWSITENRIFYKMPISASTTSSPKIMRMEYFVDADPGNGNATPINFTTVGDSTYQVFSISASPLSVGFHNLSVRVQDSLGFWSISMSKIFYRMNSISSYSSTKITALEYYYDIDPGVGNGIALSINEGDTVSQILSTSINGLDSGYHFICLRAKDSIGIWSLVMSDTFRILGCNSPNASFASVTDICVGDTLFLANSTSGIDQWIDYKWDINNDGVNDFSALGDTSYIYNTEGVYKVKLTATNSSVFSFGCVDTMISTIIVHPIPQTAVTVYGSGIICPGTSMSLSTTTGLGYSYQWLHNDTAIINATAPIYAAYSNGDYSVKVTSFYGCVDTSTISTISTYSMPSANITVVGNNSFCFGDSAVLNASTGVGLSYIWYKNGSPLMSDTLNTLSVLTPGSYKVQILSTDGCLDESASEIITVNPLPIVNLFALSSSVFCDGDSVILQSNTGANYTYEWYNNGTVLPNDTLFQLSAFTTANYSVKITNSNNCSALSATASVISNVIPTSDFSMLSSICSSDTALITYTGSASSSAFYNWDFDGGIVLSGTGQGPYEIKWATAGNKYPTLGVSENSCISQITNDTIDIKMVASTITAPITSVCQGDSVMLYANAGQNFSYEWLKTGLQLPNMNNTSLVVLQSGDYQVKVTDTIIGCSQLSSPISISINPTDFNIDFTANTTSFNQPPFDVIFTNQTPNMSNYQFDWDFGDGITSNFYNPGHSYQYNGLYSVNIYAENSTTGCRDTLVKIDYISCSGGAPNPCTILSAISPSGPATICNGDSVLLTASSGTGYTYQWAYNNMIIPNADSVVFYAKQSGNYRVIITDAVCSQTSPAFVLNQFPSIEPVIQVSGIIQPCTNDSLNLSLLVNYNTYNWNTGDTVASIYVNQTGYYQVAVTDNYGCNMVSSQYMVSNSYLNPPELCLVGVDTLNHNRLVWERQQNALIDSFYVYKESFIAGQYDKIGSVPFNQTSIFVDQNSNPAIKAYKYKIAAVDTCGGLSLLGNYHKTIHLTINAGLNGSWNLIWDGYEGFAFNTYRIYRGTNTNNMSLLTQLASTANSYTDLNPPTGTVFYQIEVIKTTGCYPDTAYAKANTNYNSSRSNTANNANINPVFLAAEFGADFMSGVWPIEIGFSDNSTGDPDTWLWDFGDGNTSVVQNPTHTYNNTGLYTVSLAICNGEVCDTIIKTDYIEVLPNGMVDIDVQMSAKIYPNPNDGNFILEINDKASHQLQLHLYNNLGSEVYSESFKSMGKTIRRLQLNRLSTGVYYVHINSEEQMVYKTKLIIQR